MKPAEANVVLNIYSNAALLDDYEPREEDFINKGWKAYFKIAKVLHDKGISLTEYNINFYL